jgi:hypothetical protein
MIEEETPPPRGSIAWLNQLGKFFFVMACISFLLISAYCFAHRHTMQWQDYAELLGGFAGFFMTASGVIYLVQTIRVTQSEMERTSSLMSNQLAESTFFNLLNNYKKNFEEERKDLAKDITIINDFFKIYSECMEKKRFKINQLNFTPEGYFEASPRMQLLGESILHIANLIEEQFEEDKRNFYHKTLYTNLNPSERFLIGMMLTNYIDISVKENYNFFYQNYYWEQANYFKSVQTYRLPQIAMKDFKYKIYLPILVDNSYNRNMLENAAPINWKKFDNSAEITWFLYKLKDYHGNELTTEHVHKIPENKRTNFSFLLDVEDIANYIFKETYTKVSWRMEVVYFGEKFMVDLQSFNICAYKINPDSVEKDVISNDLYQEYRHKFESNEYICLEINSVKHLETGVSGMG